MNKFKGVMKRFTILISTILFIQLTTFSQSCLPDGITFTTQEEIDNFHVDHPNCTEIEGDVLIRGSNITNLNGLSILTSFWDTLTISYTSLANLTGLDNITFIGGSCNMYSNDTLISLSGFDNLETIDGSLILGSYHYWSGTSGNENLLSLEAMESLTTIGGNLTIVGNHSITSLSGLDSLNFIGGDLTIGSDSSLTSLTGLESLTSLEGDLILGVSILYEANGNPLLTSLSGLDNVTAVNGNLLIYDHDALSNINGLGSLNYIGGSLSISDNDSLINLTGLENLDSIGGGFGIASNHSLTDLTGVENVVTLGEDLRINENYSLSSLSALSNLVSLTGTLKVNSNPVLTNLIGLDNIDGDSFNYLIITENDLLSECDVQSICDWLARPNTNGSISDNATGCNSPEEVEEACETVSVDELQQPGHMKIYPNPFSTSTTFELDLNESGSVELKIFNQLGELVEVIRDNTQPGKQTHIWDASNLPSGIYFIRIQTKNEFITQKLMKL